jgi:hypothetical protein
MSTDESKRADYRDLLAPFPHPADSQPLMPLYFRIRNAPRETKEIITEVYAALSHRIDAYWGPPDVWHNLATRAAALHLDDAEYQFYISGLSAWPESVDLLCDLLNEYTGIGNQHYNQNLARKTWQILDDLPRYQTAPYWRFWVFAAIYYARIEGNTKRGVELLDEGLLSVRRDGLMDIMRAYRKLLVDQKPVSPINQIGELNAEQQDIIDILEQRYMLGIRLGVENGYVLATDLARLYQERSGTRAVDSVLKDAHSAQVAVNEDLDKALTYLKLAEALYTGDLNHRVEDIYRVRVRILMAQGHYGEALRILQSMPEATEDDLSMKTMLRLAILSTGGKLDDVADDQRSSESGGAGGLKASESAALEHIFDGEGATLATLVQQNAQVRATFFGALKILQNEQEQ